MNLSLSISFWKKSAVVSVVRNRPSAIWEFTYRSTGRHLKGRKGYSCLFIFIFFPFLCKSIRNTHLHIQTGTGALVIEMAVTLVAPPQIPAHAGCLRRDNLLEQKARFPTASVAKGFHAFSTNVRHANKDELGRITRDIPGDNLHTHFEKETFLEWTPGLQSCATFFCLV